MPEIFIKNDPEFNKTAIQQLQKLLNGEPTTNEIVDTFIKCLPTSGTSKLWVNEVLAKLMLHSDYDDAATLGNATMDWAYEHYVGERVGAVSNDIVRLHEFLVKNKAKSKRPYDFEHADRYAAYYADEDDFKSMALTTQNYTYLIVMVNEGGTHPTWSIHMRYATSGRYSTDFCVVPFEDLSFLKDRSKSGAERYDDDANEYFRYHDLRDRGYLCSVTNQWWTEKWRAENANIHFSMLKSVFYDLMCHVSMIDHYGKDDE